MVLRILLRYLANNEQLIERLSQSYPIRRAAQLTAYLITKGKYKSEEILKEGVSKTITDEAGKAAEKFKSFSERFKEEFKEEYSKKRQEVEEEYKQQNEIKKRNKKE